MSEIARFLNFIFSEKDPEHYVLIWDLPNKHSKFCKTVQEACDYVEMIKDASDVYFGCGLQDSPKKSGRGLEEDIVGIPTLWLDIDITDDAHQKKNLPSSTEDAMEIIESLPWQPSLVVHSGHGLHVHWKLREIATCATEEERTALKNVSQRFQTYIRSLFLSKGWTVDSTHNLDRVLRVPGTMNRKKSPVPCQILSLDEGVSYNISDFDEIPEIEDLKEKERMYVAIDMDGIVLDPKASPPIENLELFREVDSDFDKSWNHTRKDFPSGDYSQSTYDQSLATMACIAGWEPQDIVNLVIANRRKFNQDLKLRKDYYQRLLSNGKAAAIKTKARRDIEENRIVTEEQLAQVGNEGIELPIEKSEAIWETYSNLWGFKIRGIYRTLYDPRTYRMDTARGRIEIGSCANFYAQSKFRALVGDAVKLPIPEEKKGKWMKHAAMMMTSARDEDPGEEATDLGMMTSWIAQYLEMHHPCPEESENWHDEVLARQPFLKNGATFIFLESIMSWVNSTRKDSVRQKRMSHLLRLVGIENDKVHVMVEGEDTTKSVWKVPDKLITKKPDALISEPAQEDDLPDDLDL